ncbi:hypothetical protein ACFLSS_00895 [Bacteroidota bacterium]
MINYEDTFIRYLDDQLSEDEKRKFENLIETDEKLFAEFQKFKQVNDLFSENATPAMNNDYFNGVIPEFRRSIEKKKSPAYYRKYEMVFTSLFLIITSFFIAEKLFTTNSLKIENIQTIVNEFSEEEWDETANYYFDKKRVVGSDSESLTLLADTNMSLQEISGDISPEEKISIISEYNLTDIYSAMESDLLETAYNEILDKRFF